MLLSELSRNTPATVRRVTDRQSPDSIAERLRDLGFVDGEPLQIVAKAPLGGDPLLVRIGSTRFALRKTEAARVEVDTVEAAAP